MSDSIFKESWNQQYKVLQIFATSKYKALSYQLCLVDNQVAVNKMLLPSLGPSPPLRKNGITRYSYCKRR